MRYLTRTSTSWLPPPHPAHRATFSPRGEANRWRWMQTKVRGPEENQSTAFRKVGDGLSLLPRGEKVPAGG
jgi:hypothetical protein